MRKSKMGKAVAYGLVLGLVFGSAYALYGCFKVKEVPVDIEPQSCPNPINIDSQGILLAAILGTEDFDVTEIVPESIKLRSVAPLSSALEDVAAPFEPYTGKEDAYDCTDEGADGLVDLILEFDAQEVIDAIEAFLGREAVVGDVVVLSLTGNLKKKFRCTLIQGEDVVVIVVDNDGDGFTNLEDCDDEDATIYPGAPELCDSIDNQCPGDEGYGEVDEGCGPSGKIVFHSLRHVYDIYVMNEDGSNETNLTNNPSSDDTYPDWSPDGSKIVFCSERDTGNKYQIYVMDADGSNVTRLTYNTEEDVRPAWSPDRSKIAFDSRRDRNRDIYVMDMDGNNQIRLTYHTSEDAYPAWSPDGKKIAFQSNRDNTCEIYVMNADGTGQTNITNNTADDHNPAWSPDGSKIVFEVPIEGKGDIFVMDADGSNQTNLTNNSANDFDPTWSPDGSKIVFASGRDGNMEIYIMDADGSNVIRLTYNPTTDAYPDWSQ